MLTLDKVKGIDIPLNIRKKNNINPATQGLVLYNDSVNLYKAIELIIDEIGVSNSLTQEVAQDAVGSILTNSGSIMFTYNDATPSITATAIPGGIDHNSLLNFVANKHIDHSTVSIIAGTGLSGGGDITTSRTLNLANTAVTAGTYGSASSIPVFTVDAQGRITTVVNTPIVISTGSITGLTEAIGDAVAALLVAGSGINLNYNDGANTLTVSSTTTGTVTSVNVSAPASGFTITGGPITSSGTFVFTLNNDLLGVENISTTGLAARTAANTWTTRTITGTASNISVTNGDGVSGNPTVNLITTAVVADTYGSSNTVPVITVDAYGRITNATDTPILIDITAISNFTEQIQDILGSTIVGGTGITVTYDDISNTVTIASSLGTLTASDITDFSEAVDDRVAALLVAGTNITLAYNDVANTLTINSTASGGVTGSGGPLQVAYWNGAGTALTSTSDFIFDGTNLGINTPTVAVNSILTTKGISAGALSWGYSHLDVSDNIVFSVADNGELSIGDASNTPLNIGDYGISKSGGYYLSTGSGNIQLIPAGIIHLASAVGINTATVGSNVLRVAGSVRFDLTSDATGDIYYRNSAGNFTRLPIGLSGEVLTVSAGLPAWGAGGGGGGGSLPAGSLGDILVNDGMNYVSVSPIVETRTGLTGSSVTLGATPLTYTSFTLYRNGQHQIVTDDYTLAGNALSLTTALVSTDKITAIYYI